VANPQIVSCLRVFVATPQIVSCLPVFVSSWPSTPPQVDEDTSASCRSIRKLPTTVDRFLHRVRRARLL